MNTSVDSIARAAIRQPSINRCGTRAITSRSLNAPGSDSSALTTRYFGFELPRSISDALRPIGKPAPPRPRRFASSRSSISFSGLSLRAFGTPAYPPIAWYSASFVRSRSSVCASRTLRAPIDPPHDRRYVLGLHVLVIAAVDRDHRRIAAAAQALARAERDLAVLGRLPGDEVELGLERLDDPLGPDERAREVRAHLDEVL